MLPMYVALMGQDGIADVSHSLQSELVGLALGVAILGIAVYWTISGKVWKPRTVVLLKRSEAPGEYWFGVAMYYLASAMVIAHFFFEISHATRR